MREEERDGNWEGRDREVGGGGEGGSGSTCRSGGNRVPRKLRKRE